MKAVEIMSKKVATMEHTATTSEAIARMREKNIHAIPVEKEGKYFGMITYREILRRRSVQPTSKLVNFALQSPGIEPNDDLMEVAKKLTESGAIALPVLEKNKIVGIISRTDLVAHISDLADLRDLTCGEVMTREPEYALDTDDVDVAMEKMRSINSSEMPICDETKKFVGVVKMDDASKARFGSKERVRFGQYTTDRNPIEISCGSIMVIAEGSREKDLLSEATSKIVKSRLHILPVVDANNILIGTIRTSDIVDLIISQEDRQGILVSVSGLDPGEEDLYDITYFLADKFITRFYRLTNHRNGVLNINVAKYKKEGKTKFSVRTRLLSGRISLTFDSYDWNYAKCIADIFDGYEKRLKKVRGKD